MKNFELDSNDFDLALIARGKRSFLRDHGTGTEAIFKKRRKVWHIVILMLREILNVIIVENLDI